MPLRVLWGMFDGVGMNWFEEADVEGALASYGGGGTSAVVGLFCVAIVSNSQVGSSEVQIVLIGVNLLSESEISLGKYSLSSYFFTIVR
jgi:hypothetical protein